MSIDFSKAVTAQAALMEAVRQAVDAHVEATAKGKGYNSAAHCASYAPSTVEAWAAEAAAFIAWRDAVWLAVFAGMADPPEDLSPASVVEALPNIQWPGV